MVKTKSNYFLNKDLQAAVEPSVADIVTPKTLQGFDMAMHTLPVLKSIMSKVGNTKYNQTGAVEHQ